MLRFEKKCHGFLWQRLCCWVCDF